MTCRLLTLKDCKETSLTSPRGLRNVLESKENIKPSSLPAERSGLKKGSIWYVVTEAVYLVLLVSLGNNYARPPWHLLILLLPLVFLWKRRESLKSLGLVRGRRISLPASLRESLTSKGYYKGATLGMALLIVLLIFSSPSRGVSILEAFTFPGLETFLRAVVLAPVCEEMFFRGYYQPKCESRFGRKPGLFLTASLFAIIHIPNMLPQYFARPLTMEGLLLIFLFGLLIGAVRDETESVYYPIAFHALWNYIV